MHRPDLADVLFYLALFIGGCAVMFLYQLAAVVIFRG